MLREQEPEAAKQQIPKQEEGEKMVKSLVLSRLSLLLCCPGTQSREWCFLLSGGISPRRLEQARQSAMDRAVGQPNVDYPGESGLYQVVMKPTVILML